MSLNHAGLRASLSGIEDKTYSSSVLHFRGIKYASISGRFKKPEAIEDLGGKHVDCSSFGYVFSCSLPSVLLLTWPKTAVPSA